jgi:hypothetical protein
MKKTSIAYVVTFETTIGNKKITASFVSEWSAKEERPTWSNWLSEQAEIFNERNETDSAVVIHSNVIKS